MSRLLRSRSIALTVSLLAFTASMYTAFAQSSVEQEWVEADSINIARMIELIRKHPEQILTLDVFPQREFEDLGYGYSMHESVTEGGYVATRLQIVMKNGKPVSFAATPRLPYPYKSLYERYRSFYGSLFKLNAAGEPQTFYWNYRAMSMPFGDSSYTLRFQRQIFKSPLREKFELLMSPYSGTEYGCGTRSSNSIPTNRQLFEEVTPALNYLLASCLLRSINPATRLTAIEYLARAHSEKFKRKPMQRDIKKIYRSHPKAKTVDGFERRFDDAEALVKRFVLDG
ncbi:MAG: hypothetical protein H7X80_04530, partial [bacterium]|nr:hypothetical protein [Candidatus Kapabacteria bacterium]